MYKCSIIGFGNIAFGYDQNSQKGSGAKTHYKAYSDNQHCEIVSIYDPNSTSIPKDLRGQDISECLKSDIISICSPTELHYEHLKLCLEHKVPMIWLEKPAVSSAEEIAELESLLKSSSSTVLVNYTRRYSAPYIELRSKIDKKELKSIRINYSRGLQTNGSHLLDVLLFLLPDYSKYKLLYVSDCSDNPSAILEYEGVEIQIQGVDLDYHNLDFEVTFSDQRTRIIHNGNLTQTENKIEDPDFTGFYLLDDNITTKKNESPGLLLDSILSDLIKSHEEKTLPISNIHSALNTQKLLQSILNGSMI